MRLVCIYEDGESVEISDAIDKEPITVRGALADALFQCQAKLSDTFDYLRAEHTIRDTLLDFQADQERYVRSYVLSRTLDQRIQNTPRADVIYQAFQHGGPLATLGVFYATLDANRNLRNRGTLEFFVSKAFDKSKVDMFMRVNTFPCSSWVTTWLYRILEKLESDSQILACILRHLGTSNIPQELFSLSRIGSPTWGPDGEATVFPAKGIPIIQQEQLFTAALRDLERVGFVCIVQGNISLNTKVAVLLEEHLNDNQWGIEAAKIVVHAFPKYRNINPVKYV